MRRAPLFLTMVLAAGHGMVGAQEPTLKDDVKTLTSGSGEWQRPADKGPK